MYSPMLPLKEKAKCHWASIYLLSWKILLNVVNQDIYHLSGNKSKFFHMSFVNICNWIIYISVVHIFIQKSVIGCSTYKNKCWVHRDIERMRHSFSLPVQGDVRHNWGKKQHIQWTFGIKHTKSFIALFEAMDSLYTWLLGFLTNKCTRTKGTRKNK
jgi:hypothetical protein